MSRTRGGMCAPLSLSARLLLGRGGRRTLTAAGGLDAHLGYVVLPRRAAIRAAVGEVGEAGRIAGHGAEGEEHDGDASSHGTLLRPTANGGTGRRPSRSRRPCRAGPS